MPTYIYTARDRGGHALNGYLEAATQDSALATLQNKGFLITSIVTKLDAGVRGASKRRKIHTRVTLTDQILFCRQLGTMLDAGVPLLRSLEVLRNQMESKRLLLVLNDVIRDVEGGQTFRDALAKHPKVFSPFWINLVETGEASGHLGQSLSQLAQFLERAKMIREKLISALLYPGVLIIMSMVALTFFSIVVIPMFQTLFSQFHSQLPTMTLLVVNGASWVRRHFLVLAGGLCAVGWLVKWYVSTPQGRAVWDTYSLRLPVIGTLLYEAQIARFASGLSTLLESGVPILFALEILERSADNVRFGQALSVVKNDVREGKPMAVPLEATALFPPMVVQMVQVGEEIGELSTMLGRVAAYYEELINTLAERMSVLFEPIALIVVGSFIGFLVVALFLPLFNIATIQ